MIDVEQINESKSENRSRIPNNQAPKGKRQAEKRQRRKETSTSGLSIRFYDEKLR